MPLKFHGHKSLFASPFRELEDVLCNLILIERRDITDTELSVSRMKGIYIDSGRKYNWLAKVISACERSLGLREPITPSYLWSEQMWHAPLLLR